MTVSAKTRRALHAGVGYVCASEASGKHTSGVWQLRWIEKERGSEDDHAEVLVSVSTDGRVTQWAIRKGFESTGISHSCLFV